MKVHEAIARALHDLGVNHLFGVMGDANLYVVDSYVRNHSGTYIKATHEANAVLMALGYARVSGRVGAATITHGPALTNALTALVEGVRTSAPIVLLAGDTPAVDKEHNQNLDQRRFIEAAGAGYELFRSPQTLIEDLERSYLRALQELRPIVFNMPVQFQWEDTAYRKPRRYLAEQRGVIPSSNDMDHAIGMIASSHAPVVLGGRGVAFSKKPDAVQAFAQRVGAPTATTLRAKGLFADDPFNLGVCGTVSDELATEILGESDCIISFGASFNRYTAALGGFTRNKRIIQVNQLPAHIGRYAKADVGLIGDPGLTAEAMMQWLDTAEIPDAGRRTDELRTRISRNRTQKKADITATSPGRLDIFQAMRWVDEKVDADRIFVTDTGRFLAAAWPNINVSAIGNYVDTIGCSSIGLGVGVAIGCSVAAPEQTTLLVVGDGGLAMGGLAELSTVARENLNLVVVVCNDQAYGAEYVQFKARDMDAGLSVNDWLDFTAMARVLGIPAVRLDGNEAEAQVEQLIEEQKSDGGPLLIEIMVDPETMPLRT